MPSVVVLRWASVFVSPYRTFVNFCNGSARLTIAHCCETTEVLKLVYRVWTAGAESTGQAEMGAGASAGDAGPSSPADTGGGAPTRPRRRVAGVFRHPTDVLFNISSSLHLLTNLFGPMIVEGGRRIQTLEY
jgi:hypothetical protein